VKGQRNDLDDFCYSKHRSEFKFVAIFALCQGAAKLKYTMLEQADMSEILCIQPKLFFT
jgi:hypothetical protein